MRLLQGPEGTLYLIREDTAAPLRFLHVNPIPRPGVVGMMPDATSFANMLRDMADRIDAFVAEEEAALQRAGLPEMRGPTPGFVDGPHVEGSKLAAGATVAEGGAPRTTAGE
jgi:hypothetical protein